jgi:hypothetical protein
MDNLEESMDDLCRKLLERSCQHSTQMRHPAEQLEALDVASHDASQAGSKNRITGNQGMSLEDHDDVFCPRSSGPNATASTPSNGVQVDEDFKAKLAQLEASIAGLSTNNKGKSVSMFGYNFRSLQEFVAHPLAKNVNQFGGIIDIYTFCQWMKVIASHDTRKMIVGVIAQAIATNSSRRMCNGGIPKQCPRLVPQRRPFLYDRQAQIVIGPAPFVL